MLILLLFAGFTPALSQTQTPADSAPAVSPPVIGGERGAFGGFSAASAPGGYVEDERFLSGTATAFAKTGAWGVDGAWSVMPASTAEFRIRMLVRRPADAARFNGILLVEWLNVTGLSEGAADYMMVEEEIVRGGYAWVGIGAQAAGVNAPRTGLKAWDATRYGSLVHPGDAYSYDIFSQAARALRASAAQNPVGALPVRSVIAMGRSQSAFRLVTYINALHPRQRLFDGFLVHSRGGQAAGLTAESLAADATAPVPAGAHLRVDTNVPVLDVQTEGDMITLRSHLTRQPPHARYRRWEIAGAAHAEVPRWVAAVPPALSHGMGCQDPVNAAPHHAVVKAALQALTRWVRDGVVPPQSPDIELADPARPDPVARDPFGNARGGIRLPELEAPTAVLDGTVNSVATPAPGVQNFCRLFGRTVLFDAATLAKLYPSADAYLAKFNQAVDAIVRDGYWLKPEGDAARAAAAEARIAAR